MFTGAGFSKGFFVSNNLLSSSFSYCIRSLERFEVWKLVVGELSLLIHSACEVDLDSQSVSVSDDLLC